VIDPPDAMVRLSAAPLATVEVFRAVVVALLIVVSAAASAILRAARTGAMAVQASRCRMMSPLRAALDILGARPHGTVPKRGFRQAMR
jgi:hypothetical protein